VSTEQDDENLLNHLQEFPFATAVEAREETRFPGSIRTARSSSTCCPNAAVVRCLLLKAGTDQSRRSSPCRAKRSRTLQARSVWTGCRAQTRNNAHEQSFANIIRLMSVHQRNLLVRARSIWTDFLCL
jgi:hypothetical protein